MTQPLHFSAARRQKFPTITVKLLRRSAPSRRPRKSLFTAPRMKTFRTRSASHTPQKRRRPANTLSSSRFQTLGTLKSSIPAPPPGSRWETLSSRSRDIDQRCTRAKMNSENGIVTQTANCTVEEAVNKIKSLLVGRGIALFAVIDHSGEAEAAGMKMPDTKLLIFGNPKGGTPLMLASPSVAIDLPLKLLVAEDAAGRCSISYNSPQYLQQRHGLPRDLIQNIAIIEALATEAAA